MSYTIAVPFSSIAKVSEYGLSTITVGASSVTLIDGSTVTSGYASFDTTDYAYKQANTATVIANAGYAQANAGIAFTQQVYNYANTIGGGSAIDNVARITAQSAFTQANTAYSRANSAYNQANTATTIGNAAYSQANTATTIGNAGYNQANIAYNQANSAYTQANTGVTIAQASYNYANTLASGSSVDNVARTTAQAAFNAANTNSSNISSTNAYTVAAYNQANTASSNTVTIQAVNVYQNTIISQAQATAQAAFNTANSALPSSGGTISNSLTITTSLGVGTAGSGTTGEIRATNEVTAYYSSDETLKENIVVINDALGKLKQVRGVMYDWKDSVVQSRGGLDDYFVRKHDTGVIAQEVEKVLPEVVATRPDGTKAVRYEKMAGIIIQAINELANQVEEIKKRLN